TLSALQDRRAIRSRDSGDRQGNRESQSPLPPVRSQRPSPAFDRARDREKPDQKPQLGFSVMSQRPGKCDPRSIRLRRPQERVGTEAKLGTATAAATSPPVALRNFLRLF